MADQMIPDEAAPERSEREFERFTDEALVKLHREVLGRKLRARLLQEINLRGIRYWEYPQ